MEKSLTKEDVANILCNTGNVSSPDNVIKIISLDEFKTLYNSISNTRKINVETHLGIIPVSISKTSKVVIKDNYHCKYCKANVTHVAIIHPTHGINKNLYHFNFICINEYGEYSLLTKDHIIPKSKKLKGINSFDNLQSLCFECNQEKDNTCDLSNIIEKPELVKQIEIYKNYYDENHQKVKDFKRFRKHLKQTIKFVPWYYKLLRVDKFIEKQIKKYLEDKGYYKDDR